MRMVVRTGLSQVPLEFESRRIVDSTPRSLKQLQSLSLPIPRFIQVQGAHLAILPWQITPQLRGTTMNSRQSGNRHHRMGGSPWGSVEPSETVKSCAQI